MSCNGCDISKDECYVSLGDFEQSNSEDLVKLPRTIKYINLTKQRNLETLDGLQGCRDLEYVDCSLCTGLHPEAVKKFQHDFPKVDLDLYGCAQISDRKSLEEEMRVFDVCGLPRPPFDDLRLHNAK